MSKTSKVLFGIILGVYLLAGVLYATLTPNWQAPDEPAHYNYIRYLAANAGFPELTAGCYNQGYLDKLKTLNFPPELPIDGICYEFHQPPLYYLMGTPVFMFSNGTVVALRLLSVSLGAGVVALAFLIAQTIFPDRVEIAFGTMAFAAFIPMHGAILASVNNDSLAELIFAALLYLLTRRLCSEKKVAIKSDVLLGLLLGVGLVTKTTVYIAIPLVAIALFLGVLQLGDTPSRWLTLLKQAAVIYSPALLVAIPWYGRNMQLYKGFDILGLNRHDEIVIGQLRTADFLTDVGMAAYINSFITTTFHSFWGQFGWMAVPMDGRTYTLLALLTLLALAGLVAFWVNPSSPPLSFAQQRALILMGSAVILVALAYAGYNFVFVQFQGRYLFPGLIPLGIFFALGLAEALNRRWRWWLVCSLAVALVWIAVNSALGEGLDKWTILIVGLAMFLAGVRVYLEQFHPGWTWVLLGLCFTGLGVLTLVAPFWFVVPYL